MEGSPGGGFDTGWFILAAQAHNAKAGSVRLLRISA